LRETDLPKIHVYELHEWIAHPAGRFDYLLFFTKRREISFAEAQYPLNKYGV
jgi:hypothetical protein